jgi:hypothetical protein
MAEQSNPFDGGASFSLVSAVSTPPSVLPLVRGEHKRGSWRGRPDFALRRCAFVRKFATPILTVSTTTC